MKWTLKSYLDRHNLTPHQLALEAKLSVNTVYPMARGQAERISLQTIDRVISALRSLTGERVDIADLLAYGPEETLDAETRAWHDSDLSRLGEYEPYDWGETDPETVGERLQLGNP